LPAYLSTVTGTFDKAPLYRLNYDYSLTPTLLLHLGGGYRSNYFNVPSVTPDGQLVNYNASQQLGLKGGLQNKFFPIMSGLIQGASAANPTGNGTGGIKTIGSESGSTQITQSPSFNASLTWVKSNHTYKAGSEFRTEGYPPIVGGNTDGTYSFSAAQTGQPFQNTAVNGSNTGFAYASFLLGQVDGLSISRPTHPRMGKKQLGHLCSGLLENRSQTDFGLRLAV